MIKVRRVDERPYIVARADKHPVGLILTSSAREIWLSMMIAWLCKTTILRYGGAKAHRAGRTFFMGLALGEAAIATLWIIVGLLTHVGVRFLP